MAKDWMGNTYDLMAKNCCSFADAFCLKLGVKGLPKWVDRFARAGAAVKQVGHKISDAGSKAVDAVTHTAAYGAAKSGADKMVSEVKQSAAYNAAKDTASKAADEIKSMKAYGVAKDGATKVRS